MRVVFDLDGTLIDSAPDLQAAINRVMADWGASPFDLEAVTRFIGNGIPTLVSLAREARGIDVSEQPSMTERMFQHYSAAPATLTKPFADVIPTLQQLVHSGARLGLCTNKAKAPTLSILAALDMEHYFDAVIGGDSLAVKKPDPAPLLATFDALGGPGLYVGDSEVDAACAKAANTPFALFTRGYRKTAVDDMPHAFAFDDFKALPEKLRAFG